LTDSDALRALAIDTNVKELGLAALDKLDGDDVLEQIAHKAKAKAVRQRARKRLDDKAAAREAARPKESDAVRRKRAEKAQWLRAVEILAETFEFDKHQGELAKGRGGVGRARRHRRAGQRRALRQGGDAVPHPPGGGGQDRRRRAARGGADRGTSAPGPRARARP
jgi:hypothetical protein